MASKSLKHTIIIRLLVPVFCFLLIETALSYWMTLHYVDKTNDRWLLNSAHSLEQEIKVTGQKISIELSANALEVFSWDDLDKTYFRVVSENQGELAGDPELPELDLIDGTKPVFFNSLIYNEPIRVVAIQVKNQAIADKVTIYFAETLHKRQEMMTDILLADLIPQLLFTILISLYLFKNIKIILSPFHKLSKQIARRSPQDLSPMTDTYVFTEVKTLTDTINLLLSRLTAAIAAQQRFIANAAHQLRTPLAGLKLQAEVAQRENNLDTMRTSLRQMQNSTDRVSHMVTQLLALARSEPIEGSQKLKRLDLQLLVREVCIEWVPKALQEQLELSFDGPDHPVWIKGDAVLLKELLSNLIDNAISYGHVDGNVVVKLSSDELPILQVEDDGDGIPEEEQTRIFERFYRIQSSSGNGCGLGLAIVKEIADLHQAKVQISNRIDRKGAVVSVLFKRFPSK
ncbi:two-component system, OmpR family, sensor histidine kinase TctE [Bathymodiolus platifrons methanotrophic gill symbiont]|uniref:sensor histidine kinase n=1 Tax=Bathymodiolus platifrons methanotrophic gill symbiont TaxID=113268 RepID=UPI000B4160F5|nr:sensor histidine kinase [Bathymodiolus platifrons methanotrophic gill symbiont]MCK5870395.1 sensor histidine kinase N-terminal domain-containing protein [Methyloprofundus sp.]TXK95650.1 sensor histidine kinase [Methylococcaceae bacterium CS4]TXK99605.1 sensor histidine kinase [Methylococcaceae bacterium CS5]TXL03742.1 sensor histidine kinase [Methylococcaceae bacterium CS1]TXL08162.1 sensor histidine kinase [Methylococcaceae bacterium CS3]TXL09965.1 sensor histidine kinase [Methylococcacea